MPIPRNVRISFFLNKRKSDEPNSRPTYASTVSQNMTATKAENSTIRRLHRIVNRMVNKGFAFTHSIRCLNHKRIEVEGIIEDFAEESYLKFLSVSRPFRVTVNDPAVPANSSQVLQQAVEPVDRAS